MAVSGAEQRNDRLHVNFLAWFALGGVIVYVGIDVLLRFLRPQYSLIYNAESDYGRGSWYWVMDLNFLLRCAFSLAIAGALSQTVRSNPRVRSGLVLLVVWAVCSGLLAFFADDLEGQPVHGSGHIHIAFAFVAFTSVAVGTVLISSSLMSDPAWHAVGAVLFVVSLLGAAAFLLMGAALRHKHGPDGLYERIFLGLELSWIALAAGFIAIRRPLTKLAS